MGPKTFKLYSEVRVFILISTVMTWALTKPIDPVSILYLKCELGGFYLHKFIKILIFLKLLKKG